MVGEKFESFGVQITGKGICKFKKLKTDIFTYSRQAELSLPGSYYHSPSGRGKFLILENLFPQWKAWRKLMLEPL